MRATLIAVVVLGCKYSEPMVGGDAPIDLPFEGHHDCAAVEIASGGDHSCARLSDGSMSCWGANDRGQIGVAAQTTCGGTPCNPTPVQVPLSTVMSLGLGDDHTCALTGNGVYCWGANQDGEFGDGTTNDSATPTVIASRAGTEMLVAGDSHTCSLKTHQVLCSGKNEFGELGIGNTNPSTVPVPALTTVVTVTKIAAGFNHMVVVSDANALFGWGYNAANQLDSVDRNDRLTPISLNMTNVLQVAAGALHTCVLIASDHHVACRGSNAHGQLAQVGTGTFGFVPVTSVSNVDMIAAGGEQTCVLAGGMVRCFGLGFSSNPVLITLPHPATAITAGTSHACALLDDQSVWCWGSNANGQLGDGTTTSHQTNPVPAVCT